MRPAGCDGAAAASAGSLLFDEGRTSSVLQPDGWAEPVNAIIPAALFSPEWF